MADLTVPQPPLIDSDGNINVHGRAGFSVAVKMWSGNPNDPAQSQIDVSGFTLTFELDVEGVNDVPLVPDPDDLLGQKLIIPSLSDAGIFLTPGNYPAFAVRDTTGAYPAVLWEGRFIVRGWE